MKDKPYTTAKDLKELIPELSYNNCLEIIMEDAKKNASRIVNEALLRAEKTEMETAMLRKNINVFKRKLKDIIESQLEIVDDIEKVEL